MAVGERARRASRLRKSLLTNGELEALQKVTSGMKEDMMVVLLEMSQAAATRCAEVCEERLMEMHRRVQGMFHQMEELTTCSVQCGAKQFLDKVDRNLQDLFGPIHSDVVVPSKSDVSIGTEVDYAMTEIASQQRSRSHSVENVYDNSWSLGAAVREARGSITSVKTGYTSKALGMLRDLGIGLDGYVDLDELKGYLAAEIEFDTVLREDEASPGMSALALQTLRECDPTGSGIMTFTELQASVESNMVWFPPVREGEGVASDVSLDLLEQFWQSIEPDSEGMALIEDFRLGLAKAWAEYRRAERRSSTRTPTSSSSRRRSSFSGPYSKALSALALEALEVEEKDGVVQNGQEEALRPPMLRRGVTSTALSLLQEVNPEVDGLVRLEDLRAALADHIDYHNEEVLFKEVSPGLTAVGLETLQAFDPRREGNTFSEVAAGIEAEQIKFPRSPDVPEDEVQTHSQVASDAWRRLGRGEDETVRIEELQELLTQLWDSMGDVAGASMAIADAMSPRQVSRSTYATGTSSQGEKLHAAFLSRASDAFASLGVSILETLSTHGDRRVDLAEVQATITSGEKPVLEDQMPVSEDVLGVDEEMAPLGFSSSIRSKKSWSSKSSKRSKSTNEAFDEDAVEPVLSRSDSSRSRSKKSKKNKNEDEQPLRSPRSGRSMHSQRSKSRPMYEITIEEVSQEQHERIMQDAVEVLQNLNLSPRGGEQWRSDVERLQEAVDKWFMKQAMEAASQDDMRLICKPFIEVFKAFNLTIEEVWGVHPDGGPLIVGMTVVNQGVDEAEEEDDELSFGSARSLPLGLAAGKNDGFRLSKISERSQEDALSDAASSRGSLLTAGASALAEPTSPISPAFSSQAAMGTEESAPLAFSTPHAPSSASMTTIVSHQRPPPPSLASKYAAEAPVEEATRSRAGSEGSLPDQLAPPAAAAAAGAPPTIDSVSLPDHLAPPAAARGAPQSQAATGSEESAPLSPISYAASAPLSASMPSLPMSSQTPSLLMSSQPPPPPAMASKLSADSSMIAHVTVFAREMFEALDLDSNGSVSIDELKAAVEAVTTTTNARGQVDRSGGLAHLALKILQEIGTASNKKTVTVEEVELALKKVFYEEDVAAAPGRNEASDGDSRALTAVAAAGPATVEVAVPTNQASEGDRGALPAVVAAAPAIAEVTVPTDQAGDGDRGAVPAAAASAPATAEVAVPINQAGDGDRGGALPAVAAAAPVAAEVAVPTNQAGDGDRGAPPVVAAAAPA